jgi:hypothetical protein
MKTKCNIRTEKRNTKEHVHFSFHYALPKRIINEVCNVAHSMYAYRIDLHEISNYFSAFQLPAVLLVLLLFSMLLLLLNRSLRKYLIKYF